MINDVYMIYLFIYLFIYLCTYLRNHNLFTSHGVTMDRGTVSVYLSPIACR